MDTRWHDAIAEHREVDRDWERMRGTDAVMRKSRIDPEPAQRELEFEDA
jgi:hypothetical protein